jgi:spore germination cell wall hydrolase CwlJ-like protein
MFDDNLAAISSIDTSQGPRGSGPTAQATPAQVAQAQTPAISPQGQTPTPAALPGDQVSLSPEAHGEHEPAGRQEQGSQVAMLVGALREERASSSSSGPHAPTDAKPKNATSAQGDAHASGQLGKGAAHDAGAQTQGAASSAEAKKVAKAQEQRHRDQETLARAIAAEARGEPYEAQVGVASVIVNNAKATKQSIHSLVHSSFLSSSSDGNSKFYRMPTAHIPNFDQFMKAAGDALDGKQPITSQHMYFTDDSIKSTPWTSPHDVITIGHMRFYKERGT